MRSGRLAWRGVRREDVEPCRCGIAFAQNVSRHQPKSKMCRQSWFWLGTVAINGAVTILTAAGESAALTPYRPPQ